ncbi:MAG: BamA/TamA family outer membrane protein [Acidobacteria bacterium]|nr:BamA/TamA family outer membrane protein [Acidobacteriota bacterium]
MTATLLALVLLAAPAVYEGETVASVRLEGEGVDVARYERYVEIPVGQPFRATVVRHVVELLHATGAFEDVVVEAERTPAGVAVVVRPVPAPLLADVRLEGDRILDAGAVRRTARLEDREPLWLERLERAARDVALHLAADGYLEARVTAAARPKAGGADAVFSVRAGPRARVGSVAVDGVPDARARSLVSVVPVRPGDVYRRRRADAAAERVRRRLVAGGHWRAAVEVREAYDPGRARVGLILEVHPGPLTSVAFDGARVRGGLRAALEAMLREGRLRGDVLEEASERLEDAFRRRGHRDVAVSYREESRGSGLAVVYQVRAGPVTQAASVAVRGAPAGIEGLVRLRPGDPVDDRRLEEDARALTRVLEESGHAEAQVEVDLPDGGGLVPVALVARPGPRTMVAALAVESARPGEALPEVAGARAHRLRPGEPYRLRDLALDRNDLLAALRNAGHLQAEVSPEVTFSEGRSEARVTLRVTPGPRTRVDHVILAGLERTRPQVVRRELLLGEGEPLGLQNVLESQRRLGALGIFERVAVTEMDPESVEARSLVVRVDEAPRTTVAYGVGYAERDLLRASAEVTRRNLSGLDRSVSTFVRASFRGNRFLTTYREPYLFGRRQELFLTGFREEEERESFSFLRYGGLVQTARNVGGRWSLVVRYTFQKTGIFDVQVPLDDVDRQFRNTTTSGPAASIIRDTRDDPLDPRRGGFLGADVQLSHRRLGGDGFVKGFLQASAYRPLGGVAVLALAGRVGLGRTLGVGVPERLPLPDRFFAGGDYSLRGFKLDTAGPLELSTTGELVPTGGNALVLGGAELRFDLGRFLSAAAFGEAGTAYRLVSDVDLGALRLAAGIGLRYRSALGPLRIDWGYKLGREPDESPSRFHFTIGHAF